MKNKFFYSKIALLTVLAMILTLFTPINSIALADDVDITATAQNNKNEIVILSINDFHGSVEEEVNGKNLGMKKLVTAINNYRAANPNTIVVSAGDNYQGSAMSNLTYGAPVSDMLKNMGLVASAIGNHEFDWGLKRTEQWAKDGDFTFVAANIVDSTTKEPIEWAKPYVVKEVNGIKIGFVGLTTVETAFKASYDQVKNYEFQPIKETAEKWAKYLKSGEAPEGKVDVVIALSHVGCAQDYTTKEITGEVVDQELYKAEGIDAIIAGHSHETVSGYVEDMPVVQGYKNGRALGKLTISLNDDGNVDNITPEVDLAYKTKSDLTEDAATKEIYNNYITELNPILAKVVGTSDIELTHDRSAEGTSVLGYLVCDMIRKNVDAQIGMMNSGGIRTSISKGEITMGKLYEVLPFDNTVVKIEVTGEQLKKVVENGINNESIGWIEVAGLTVKYDMSKDFGSRVVEMYLENGTKVEMDKTYTVATNDFMATGGDQYDFTGAKSNVDTCVPIRDVVADYLASNGAVNFNFVQPLAQIEKVEEKPEDKPVVTPTQPAKEEVKEPEYITYVVVRGDCLWNIAKKFNTTYQKIAADNNIKNPNLIFVGQVLKIYKTK